MKKTGFLVFLGLMLFGNVFIWGQQRKNPKRLGHPGTLFPTYLEDSLFRRQWGGVRGWGYIDNLGRVVIPPRFTAAGHFSEGLAPVREGPLPIRRPPERGILDVGYNFTGGMARDTTRKWGYINEAGEMTIKPQFDAAGVFSEGLARVQLDGKFGFIDKSAKIVISPRFDEVGIFSGGLALVRVGNKYGYVNPLGQLAIDPGFDMATSFSEGLAVVRVGTQYGYIDRTGRIVIKPQFADAGSFSEGLAKVKVNSKWGYIDRSGNIIIRLQFEDAGSFAEGLAEVKQGASWGYIDLTGKMIIKPRFTDAHSFSGGLASVKIKDRWGYVNTLGKIVIPPQYASAEPFYKGVGVVTLYKSEEHEVDDYVSWAYIDVKGNVLIDQTLHVDNGGSTEFGSFYIDVEIDLESNPEGAAVYLIPLYDWENDPSIINDDRRLSNYRVSQGNTNVQTRQPEKVFEGVFVLGDQRRPINIDVNREGNTTFKVDFR
jgi:hypothetical protein